MDKKKSETQHNIQIEIDTAVDSTTEEQSTDFYVVGIGASAGGLEALRQFFENMPKNKDVAFVIIQHLSPDYKSYMAELLSKYTEVDVYQIQNRMKILPGNIYVNPPSYKTVISQGEFLLIEAEPKHSVNLSIDLFFDSLAVEMGENAIGIILSGTGSDGTHGCRAIKEAGGIIMAQDKKSAKFDSMPLSVIETKICDFIMPPQSMPKALLQYIEQPSLLKKIKQSQEEEFPDTLSEIYRILKEQYGIEFNLYKQTTMLRAIDRRMRINQIYDLEGYLSLIKEQSEEVQDLYNNLLIGVTQFFRNKEAYNVLMDNVIPKIIESKVNSSTIRVWVAGCSTGEEAYSLAILLKEYMLMTKINYDVKIFATDIDQKAIEYASVGIYPDSIAHDLPATYLNRYFIKTKKGYQVIKSLRDMVIFSFHNVIANPPFYKVDLLSCRNLLIYFQSHIQTRVLSSFQFAIKSNGFLFLGTSETTGELGKYFSIVDSKWKIFKRKDMKRRPLVEDFSVISTGVKVASQRLEHPLPLKVRKTWEMDDINGTLINKCLPPSVVVDESGELIQVCGDGDKFIQFPRGRVYYDIVKMVPKELATALSTALNKVKKEAKITRYNNIKVTLGEDIICINLIVKPLLSERNGIFIYVVFEEIIESSVVEESTGENYDTIKTLRQQVVDLEQELQYTKESLQTSIEEVETSSEELQSANEELLVSNEEMHSTNEELQSVNEELTIVNNQYQHKIEELDGLNNDMINFLNSTMIGTLFLDLELCVRKFTPSITKEINLIESDIGRPISHISHNLKNINLIGEAKKILSTLVPIEKEVLSIHNQWYLIKYTPYRTNTNMIKGVVISLIDITKRKEMEETLRFNKNRYEKLVELSPFAILIVKKGIIEFSNTEGLHLFKEKDIESLVGKPLKRYLNIDLTKLIKKQNESVQIDDNITIPLVEKVHRYDGSVVHVEVMMIPIPFEQHNDFPYNDAELVILRDITANKLAEKLKKENEQKNKQLEEAKIYDSLKNDFFGNLSHEFRTPLNVIMSTLQLMKTVMIKNQQHEIDRDIEKYMTIMKQNCFRQLRLINNMIDITKMDSGFFEINKKNYDIINIVENITLSVADYINAKSVELIFDTEVEEKVLACDPDSIERIILNLLSNAAKFTTKGDYINVNIYDRTDSILISVKDSGEGIPQEKLEIIFQRFRQVDKTLTRRHEGSGIGLSLVKSLVEMHGGTITVESEYKKGTEFIIKLPVIMVEKEKEVNNVESRERNNVEKITLEFSDIYNVATKRDGSF